MPGDVIVFFLYQTLEVCRRRVISFTRVGLFGLPLYLVLLDVPTVAKKRAHTKGTTRPPDLCVKMKGIPSTSGWLLV